MPTQNGDRSKGQNAVDPDYAALPEWFVGREAQVNLFGDIVRRLVLGKETKKALVVNGPVGIGKSSLVNMMKEIAAKHNCLMIVSRPSLPTPLAFFDAIFKEISDKVAEAEQKEKTGSSLPLSAAHKLASPTTLTIDLSKSDVQTVLERYQTLFRDLDETLRRRNSGLVIFIDQAERLFQTESQMSGYAFFETIAYLLRDYCSRVVLGVAVSSRYLSVFLQQCPELSKISYVREFELQALPSEQVKVLIQKRVEVVGKTIVGDVIDTLVRISEGVPFEIVDNLRLLLLKAEDLGISIVDEKVMSKVMPSLDGKFETVLSSLSQDELSVVKAIGMEYTNKSNIPSISEKLKWSSDKTREVLRRIEEEKRFEKPLIKVSDEQFVSLVSDTLYEYLRKKTIDEGQAEALIRSYQSMIRGILEKELTVPPSFLTSMIRSVFSKYAHETETLRKSFAEMGQTLIDNPRASEAMLSVQALYSAIIDMHIKDGKLDDAKSWNHEAIGFFIAKSRFHSALLFIEKLIIDILDPTNALEEIVAACKEGIEVAKSAEDYTYVGEFTLRIAELQSKDKKHTEETGATYQDAVDSYLKACNSLPKQESWKASQHLRTASLLTHAYLSDDKNTIRSIDLCRKNVTSRRVGRVIAIVGIRGAGVYAITPSIVLSSITQSGHGRRALLIDLGMEHELVLHLSSKPFHYLPPRMSLISLIERRRKKEPSMDLDEVTGLRYDMLLRNKRFRIEGNLPHEYLKKVYRLADEEKQLYVLPLATDDIAPSDILKYGETEIVAAIREISEAIKPDFLFITRPGLQKEGRFADLSPASLLNSVLDLADDIVVVCRGDGEDSLNLYLRLAKTICQTPSWRLKSHICVNRYAKVLTMPEDIQNIICFKLPEVAAWGSAVEEKRIPFVELSIESSSSEHPEICSDMKQMWEHLLNGFEGPGGSIL